MLGCEAGAAGVRGVVHKDGAGALSDLASQVGQINLPALVGQQVVGVEFDSEILADWLTKGESRFGDEDSVADFAHDRDRVVKCARAAKGQENVVWVDWVLFVAELLSDSLASRESARRLGVPIMLLALNDFNDCLIYGRRELETIGSGGFSKAEIAESFGVVLG